MTLNQVKKQEARNRMTALRLARRGRKQAVKQQRRASLVGDVTWRITNFKQVARAMAGWTRP
jgi:DNA-binding TFAR19-related protein (PDSD5 family)